MDEKIKGNKVMFWMGILFCLTAAVMFLGNFMKGSNFPIFLGILGVVSMGASGVRLLNNQ